MSVCSLGRFGVVVVVDGLRLMRGGGEATLVRVITLLDSSSSGGAGAGAGQWLG